MDTLTEILNTFFVSNKQTEHKPESHLHVKLNKFKNIEVQTELLEAPEVVPEVVEVVEEAPEVVEVVEEVPEVVEVVPVVQNIDVILNDLSERNVLIVNNSFDENINSLVNILIRLDSTLFHNELNIFTDSERKSLFKKMLIDHPDLSFTDLKFNSEENDGLCVVDFDYVSDVENITPFLSNDKYLIVLSSEYSSYIAGLYNIMNDFKPSVLVNHKDKTRVLQKKFYNKLIKNTVVSDLEFDDYIEQIVDTIIVKSGKVQL
jgi:hypothetical protein